MAKCAVTDCNRQKQLGKGRHFCNEHNRQAIEERRCKMCFALDPMKDRRCEACKAKVDAQRAHSLECKALGICIEEGCDKPRHVASCEYPRCYEHNKVFMAQSCKAALRSRSKPCKVCGEKSVRYSFCQSCYDKREHRYGEKTKPRNTPTPQAGDTQTVTTVTAPIAEMQRTKRNAVLCAVDGCYEPRSPMGTVTSYCKTHRLEKSARAKRDNYYRYKPERAQQPKKPYTPPTPKAQRNTTATPVTVKPFTLQDIEDAHMRAKRRAEKKAFEALMNRLASKEGVTHE